MFRILNFIFVALLVGACSSSAHKEEALYHLQIGTSFLERGSYPDALRELLLAEKSDPDNEIVQNNLGLAYFVREKNELAEKHLRKAVSLKSNYTEARNNLARVLIEENKFDAAVSQLNKVLRDLTYSDSAKALTNMSLAYFRQGQFTQSKSFASQALKLNRDNCLASTLFGRSQFELGEYRNAASSLDSAVVLCKQSQFDEPHYFAALTYEKLGDKEKAIARLEEVIRLYPSGKYNRKAQSMLNEIKQVQR